MRKVLLVFLLMAGCSILPRNLRTVIYGEDNRQDIYELTNFRLVELSQSVCSLWTTNNIKNLNNGYSELVTRNFGRLYNLCPNQKYREQPIGAICSGFVVDSERGLIVTAGHCINESNLGSIKFVFDYIMLDKHNALTTVLNEDVYTPVELIAWKLSSRGGDFAVVRVDRPINRKAIKLGNGPKIGNRVGCLGFPVGLPCKFSGWAKVIRVKEEYFEALLSVFGGNSGSLVFDENYNAVGCLVRGMPDFKNKNGCNEVLVLPLNDFIGEAATRVSQFEGALK